VLMDANYREICRIRSIATEKNQGDTALDGHEFLLLGEDHYIVMSYLQVEADNIPDVNQYTGEPIEHADKAILVAAYIQEIDHGEVKFEWLITEHPELYSMTSTDETSGAADFTNTDPNTYVDYVHLNAIVIDDDGDLVISCRHLNTMIKIDRNGGTGNLLWALSGVADDFGLTEDQKTSGQHYLYYHGNGYFSAFNNNNDKGPTDLVLYHINEDESALEDDGFRVWIVPGTTEVEPGLPCPPHDTYACGAFQLFGAFGVAGWGWNISGNELISEFFLDDPSQITFQLRSGYDPDGAFATYRNVKCLSAAPELDFTEQSASWTEIRNSSGYVLSIGHQDAEGAFSVGFYNTACNLCNLPNGEYAAWITETDFGVSSAESALTVEDNLTPQEVVSPQNGLNDLFFAKADGIWTSGYAAKHAGSVNDWTGTGELAALTGKNRLTDFFRGSADANILLLTDDANGDAVFLDDIYSDSPEGQDPYQSRLSQIRSILAGAGNDIIDMTSQRFEYSGLVSRLGGGDGNDTIWAGKGANLLFGDAGDDRLVGASGSDVLAGGSGNDSMHGGGGNDIFTFGGNWGADSVEQLADGSVTLWFDSGDESNWNAAALTYIDGEKSVNVSGVDADRITLKFGNDGSELFAMLASSGAFAEFTSHRIFDTNNTGSLAGN
ncbi:MAG: aryl-sulfate sulfotransferase, partial [Lentisphaeria bacterium]|nr:aryl-sulfate sulfotransferase [Lentisphaeria bacterium]